MAQEQDRSKKHRFRTHLLVLVIILATSLTPLGLYWFFYGQVPTVTPTKAKELLRAVGSQAILIDVRPAEDFNSIHIDGAHNWPLAQILTIEYKDDIPEQFTDKMLLVICNVGTTSPLVVRHLTGIGCPNVFNVRGGGQEWVASVNGPQGDVFNRFVNESGEIVEFPFRPSPLYEQLALVISAFPIKISYTVLSLLAAIILWRSSSPDLKALRWSMVFFFVGENCCAINYYIFRNGSYLFEYLHGLGMLLAFGFVTYAIFEGFDRRILMLSEPDRRCAAIGLCKKCIKYEKTGCKLRQAFFVVIPALIFIAFLPLSTDWYATSYNTIVFGTFFNYSHPLVHQVFEKIYCPTTAAVLFAVSLLILIFAKDNPLPLAKIFFAAGVGPLGFGIFRTALLGLYNNNMVWFNFWEEATELLFIAGVCVIYSKRF